MTESQGDEIPDFVWNLIEHFDRYLCYASADLIKRSFSAAMLDNARGLLLCLHSLDAVGAVTRELLDANAPDPGSWGSRLEQAHWVRRRNIARHALNKRKDELIFRTERAGLDGSVLRSMHADPQYAERVLYRMEVGLVDTEGTGLPDDDPSGGAIGALCFVDTYLSSAFTLRDGKYAEADRDACEPREPGIWKQKRLTNWERGSDGNSGSISDGTFGKIRDKAGVRRSERGERNRTYTAEELKALIGAVDENSTAQRDAGDHWRRLLHESQHAKSH